MNNRQTKDNKKWCDLAALTNPYNSDNIHHYMVDNKSRILIQLSIETENKHICKKKIFFTFFNTCHVFTLHVFTFLTFIISSAFFIIRNVSKKIQPNNFELEWHSMERMYLRQKCFDGSLAQCLEIPT